ncbi:hypothetical protein GCM10022267_31170 [Lentzea roselyniae]|uniref:Secreted protein n=1 Tax=Lentzea roselyniae TaxID=531940 RepID=A0ABP7AXJ2_9PSEU
MNRRTVAALCAAVATGVLGLAAVTMTGASADGELECKPYSCKGGAETSVWVGPVATAFEVDCQARLTPPKVGCETDD